MAVLLNSDFICVVRGTTISSFELGNVFGSTGLMKTHMRSWGVSTERKVGVHTCCGWEKLLHDGLCGAAPTVRRYQRPTCTSRGKRYEKGQKKACNR